ncbi:hypothetical protein KXX11_003805, partial [Aspergillus fumigatus]
HHPGPQQPAGQPAAHRHPDQRQIQGRAPEHRTRHPAHRLEQCRAGRGRGRARHRLRRRHHRDRLQRHLPHRRPGQHGPGHGEGRPVRLQQLGADHHPRQRELQVRGHADAHL